MTANDGASDDKRERERPGDEAEEPRNRADHRARDRVGLSDDVRDRARARVRVSRSARVMGVDVQDDDVSLAFEVQRPASRQLAALRPVLTDIEGGGLRAQDAAERRPIHPTVVTLEV
ncbi:MAG: hypothetical protein Q8O67_32140 [Deltaproteobacteria bacterium]|nr:hypothetical protein [Deltaproteobacteria bacterium]